MVIKNAEFDSVKRSPSETEAAWMAGFADGEGLITINRQVRKYRPSPAYRGYVAICNTHREVLTIYQRIYGGKICRKNEQRTDWNGLKWADAYTWYCPASSTKKFLLDVLPFLRLKGKQARIVLEFIVKKKAFARGKRVRRGGSSALTEDEIAFRERLRTRVRLLNSKGRFARSMGVV